MIILREYKSIVFWLILVSLWIIGFCPCCNDEEDAPTKIETKEHFNKVASDIREWMNSQKKKWTFFKIIITPKDKKKDISLEIENIISKEYIHNEAAENNNENENENNIDTTGQNNINENGKVIFEKIKDPKLNAFIVESQNVKFTVEKMGGNANNINDGNIINNGDENNNAEGTKRYYYVLIKDITTRGKEHGYDDAPLFSALENTAIDNFTYSIEIVDAKTTDVTNISGIFRGCEKLTKIVGLDKWDTSNVTNMKYMFYGCSSLESLPDISKWDTSNVTAMSNMFYGCTSLTSLPDISKWDTKKVADMSFMFNRCSSLKSLPDISKWNTSNVTNMNFMFNRCSSLESLPDIAKWNIKKVTHKSNMFTGCDKLENIPDKFK